MKFAKSSKGRMTVLVSLLLSWSVFGQELRQGHVFTPEEGKADLAERAKEYQDQDSWQKKASLIRQGILAGADLSPLPAKTPLNAIRHSPKKRNGYQVENVAFQSLPGFWVTGNLYLPDEQEKMPLVLSPHGHWKGESLLEHGRFREDMQKRCATLAQMGCAVLAIDAIGFGESAELGWDHDFHPHVLKLHLWNAVRAIDFLWGIEGADHERLLVTGASGGATLTMQLAAIDQRVTVSVPCAMVSSYFYGGCDCESGMPIHVRPGFVTNPVEIAAVIAPKPQLIISDGGDWSAHTPDDVFPHLQRIYQFFDARAEVESAHFPDGRHDYGPEKRAALYEFVSRKWLLPRIKEDDVEIIAAEYLRVFDGKHPIPEDALEANQMPEFQ